MVYSFNQNEEGVPLVQEGRFLAMKRASLHIEETPSLFVNNTIYSPLHYFPSVSDRWFGEGVRL